MNSESTVKFVAYDITSYFWQQPNDLKCCPVCGKSISSTDIPPSRAVASDIEAGQGAMPAHYFSYLYKCQACPWWGIRESWAFLEAGGMADYLIVQRDEQDERKDSPTPPWQQILEDLHIYKYVQPLPEDLGKLFIGGKSFSSLESVRKSLWKDVKEFAIAYVNSKTKKK